LNYTRRLCPNRPNIISQLFFVVNSIFKIFRHSLKDCAFSSKNAVLWTKYTSFELLA